MLLAVGDFSALFSVKQRLVYAYNVFFSDLLYGVGRTLAVKCFSESFCRIGNTLCCEHTLILEFPAYVLRKIIVADNARTHHCGRIERALLVCPYYRRKRVFVRYVVCGNSFKNFHCRHNSENTVVVSAVFNGIDVRRHDNALFVGI